MKRSIFAGAGDYILEMAVSTYCPGFSYPAARWHVLMVGYEPAGFVLPVLYDRCARNGLDEATIYHMGVAPAHRGAGIGRLLLRRATRWR